MGVRMGPNGPVGDGVPLGSIILGVLFAVAVLWMLITLIRCGWAC